MTEHSGDESSRKKTSHVQSQTADFALSPQADMAELASTALHNIANVLNSVSTSLETLRTLSEQFNLGNFDKATERLAQVSINDDQETLNLLSEYFKKTGDYFKQFDKELHLEISFLAQRIEHIKNIVHTQQHYTTQCVLTEKTDVNALIDDAVVLSGWDMSKHDIRIEKQYADLPLLMLDKHKVLQILTNLISNSKHALVDSHISNKLIQLMTQVDDNTINITVKDNGVGIDKQNLEKIFEHSFSTRDTGHGLGLHSAAQSAKELGGELRVESQGLNQGAVFTLSLPIKH